MDTPTKADVYETISEWYEATVAMRKLSRRVIDARGGSAVDPCQVAHWLRMHTACTELIDCIKLAGLAEIRLEYRERHPDEFQETLPSVHEIG